MIISKNNKVYGGPKYDDPFDLSNFTLILFGEKFLLPVLIENTMKSFFNFWKMENLAKKHLIISNMTLSLKMTIILKKYKN